MQAQQSCRAESKFSNLPFQVMKVWLLKLLQDVQKGNSILKSRNKKIKEKKERKKKREEHKIIRIIKAAL